MILDKPCLLTAYGDGSALLTPLRVVDVKQMRWGSPTKFDKKRPAVR